jgi:hypothetical protein
MSEKLTQSVLKEKLRYDPETGEFVWLVPDSNRVKPGAVAGYTQHGYVKIQLLGKSYLAHRLAFLYMTGSHPVSQVDHVNRNRGENRWTNLREATPAENTRNAKRRTDNTSGYKGVYWHAIMGKWKALIRANRGTIHIGYFDTAREAAIAYVLESLELHGSFSPYNCKGGVA